MDELQDSAAAGADDSIRAVVAEAFKTHSEPEPQEASSPSAAPEPETPSGERARDPATGRFASQQEKPQADPAAPQLADTDPAREQQVAQPSNAAHQPPTSWSDDAKSHWASLPPALQQAVAKREEEMANGWRQWSEEKRAYDGVLSPLREAATRSGVDVQEGLNRLLSANAMLEQNPVQGIIEIARYYGIDLSGLNPQQQQARPVVDPTVSRLMQDVHALKTSAEQRELDGARSIVEAFAKEPGHEHFEAVRPQMQRLIDNGMASDLQSAYDMAVWSSPETRAKLIEAQTAAARNAAAQQQQVEKARRGALSVNSSPAGAPAPPAKEYDNVRDAVRDAMRQHSA